MSRIRQFLRSLGPSGAAANAGRLQVERQHEDLLVRRLERVARNADRAAADATHRAA